MNSYAVVPTDRLVHLPVDLLLTLGFAFFEGDDLQLDSDTIESFSNDVRRCEIPLDSIVDAGLDIEDVPFPIKQREVNLPPSVRETLPSTTATERWRMVHGS